MSLANIKALKSEKGFTIVELLIVIVIIGILAAIVIVAYNGITQRANDSNYKADAVSISKVAEAANADNGSYPQTAAALSGYSGANLPSSVNIYVTSGTVANTTKTSTTAPSASGTDALVIYNGTKYYAAKACGASTGLNIYYPVTASGGSLGVIKVGTGC